MLWKNKTILGLSFGLSVLWLAYFFIPHIQVAQKYILSRYEKELWTYVNEGSQTRQNQNLFDYSKSQQPKPPKTDEAIEKLLRARAAHVQSKCRQWYGSSGLHRLSKHETTQVLTGSYTFFVAPIYDLVVCAIPKVMSTTWKVHLIRMSHELPEEAESSPHHVEAIQISHNRLYLNPKVFKPATKVMTVRHPFKRLVSAYRDKYHDGNKIPSSPSTKIQEKDYENFIYPLLEKLNLTHRLEQDDLQVTFPEFLTWVIKDGMKSLQSKELSGNPHWMPYNAICRPCHFEYEFIIKAENSEEEIRWLLKHLHVFETSADLVLNSMDSANKLSLLMEKYFDQLDPKLYKKLITLFLFDFHIFQYNIPSQVSY